ncbi:MAG: putative glycosyltransferase group 1 [Elusimicrobia bacterium]|nr:MAG: putative glycosyltransferase group 1 [Elusimicrobiota bacterium]KAF0158411.1 MAG: putative glycosyltransferase group 1 [Elusimicrobiota bacterium]
MAVIRVLHIITRLDMGGAQANTLYTVKNLDKSRFSAFLACGHGGELQKDAPDGATLPLRRLVREIRPLEDLRAFFELRRTIKRLKPDVVHTHSSKAGILGRLAAFFADVPAVVHTFHGFGFNDRQPAPARFFYVLLEKICARFSDALVFVSSANMSEAAERGIGDKARYALVRSGIKLSAYPAADERAEKRSELGIPCGAPLVVSIGNLKPQKNPGDFFIAARLTAERHPDAAFVFIGGGEMSPADWRLAEHPSLKGKLFLPGWRRDSAAILAAADIFAMTSLWEGLPRSLIEALATGLPAVCYDADGVRDILRDGVNGFLVKRGDTAAMAERLSQLIRDRALRRRLSDGARGTDLAEFDIDAMVRAQERLYLSLLGEKE